MRTGQTCQSTDPTPQVVPRRFTNVIFKRGHFQCFRRHEPPASILRTPLYQPVRKIRLVDSKVYDDSESQRHMGRLIGFENRDKNLLSKAYHGASSDESRMSVVVPITEAPQESSPDSEDHSESPSLKRKVVVPITQARKQLEDYREDLRKMERRLKDEDPRPALTDLEKAATDWQTTRYNTAFAKLTLLESTLLRKKDQT